MTCPTCALELYEFEGKKICPGCRKEYTEDEEPFARDEQGNPILDLEGVDPILPKKDGEL